MAGVYKWATSTSTTGTAKMCLRDDCTVSWSGPILVHRKRAVTVSLLFPIQGVFLLRPNLAKAVHSGIVWRSHQQAEELWGPWTDLLSTCPILC